MRRSLSRLAAALRPAPDTAPVVAAAGELSLGTAVRRFWPRLRPLRRWLVLGVVLLAAAPLIAVLEVLLFQRVVDDVLVPAAIGALLPLALAYIGLNLLSAVVSGADDYLGTWVSQKFLVALRRDAFARVLAQPDTVRDKQRLGDTMSRLTSDVAAVESFMIGQLTVGVGAILKLVFFIGALLLLDWQLALAALVVVPVFWWVSTAFARFTRDVSRERRRRGGSLSSITEESLGNATLVQTYGREDTAVAAYHEQNRGIASAELAGSRVRAVFLPMVDLAELIGVLLVISLGVWSLSDDRLTLGGLLAFLTLMLQCYQPVRDLANLVPSLYAALAGVERIVELLDLHPEGDPVGAVPLPAGPGEVELRDVSLTYPGAAGAALTGFALHLHAGERVALVGPSGAGKSTVARLLSRQLQPDAGQVLIDGHDLSAHTAASVRAAVTPVLQEQLMLDATVHDVIAFSRPGADRADVESAARRADAHEFISRLPLGYDSRIGQRGRSLSGGQRQRLGLARALLRESRVLVLDEPSTGLDEAATRRLMTALSDGPRDRTVLVLTHDPVVLEHVDRVVRLEPQPAAAPTPATTGALPAVTPPAATPDTPPATLTVTR